MNSNIHDRTKIHINPQSTSKQPKMNSYNIKDQYIVFLQFYIFQTNFRESPILALSQLYMAINVIIVMFLISFLANKLTVECENLEERVNNCCFYEQNREFKKIFLVFLHNIQENFVVKYNEIFVISLESFVEVKGIH